MDTSLTDTIITFLVFALVPTASALIFKLKKITPQLQKAQVGISLFVVNAELVLKLLANLGGVLDALEKALADGELSDAEVTDIIQHGKPLIAQGKVIMANPVFDNLRTLIEDYK